MSTTGCCRGLSAKDCIRLYPNGCGDDEPDPDAKVASWFCDPCKVEVHDRRCRHCGKLERDAR